MSAGCQHRFSVHGLWDAVRTEIGGDVFGPTVNLGIFALCAWGLDVALDEYLSAATRDEAATLICLCAAIGEDVNRLDRDGYEWFMAALANSPLRSPL